jgi:hypothetical protein
MNLEELEAEVTRLEDIQEIEDLQRKYGYYFQNHQLYDVINLFSDKAESVEVTSTGIFLGKEGVRRFFGGIIEGDLGKGHEAFPGWMLNAMVMSGSVIDIEVSGNTAKGRWNNWLAEAIPIGGVVRQQWLHGYYENKYIKENGKWLFKKLHWNLTFHTSFDAGWLKVPLLGLMTRPDADAPPTAFHPYPSGFQFPISFKHPVTG